MSALMDNLEFFRVYLGDLLFITSSSFKNSLAKVKDVMKRLQSAAIKYKIDMCKFAVLKLEHLGYIITQKVIKSDAK